MDVNTTYIFFLKVIMISLPAAWTVGSPGIAFSLPTRQYDVNNNHNSNQTNYHFMLGKSIFFSKLWNFKTLFCLSSKDLCIENRAGDRRKFKPDVCCESLGSSAHVPLPKWKSN